MNGYGDDDAAFDAEQLGHCPLHGARSCTCCPECGADHGHAVGCKANDPSDSEYPLWCLDNGESSDENRYVGPFEDEAVARKEFAVLVRDDGRPWTLRRCRRARASEILLAFGGTHERLREMLDEGASEEGLAHTYAWARWDDCLVSMTKADASVARAELDQWLDKHLVVRAFICEPDSPKDGGA